MGVKKAKKKARIFDELKLALSEALDYERGKKPELRVSQVSFAKRLS
jgi:hypothetical protein